MSDTGPQGLHQAEGALSQAAGLVAETQGDLHRLADRLSGQIDGLRTGWAGAGAAAFHSLHLAWQDRQRRITGALGEFEAALQETEQATMAADQDQSDLMRHTAARLG